MRLTPISAGVIIAIGGMGPGLWQTAWSQQDDENQGTTGLEEIVVTATRRAASVQDLPLSVSAFNAEALALNNIENMEDLTAVAPNVLITGTGGGTTAATFRMRGIPNVGTYIDGIWQVTNAGLLQRQFVELERVEVLRGPQGTLYGRDSTGGSVHLYTQRPAEEFGATIDLGIGSFDRRDVRASVDLPFGDNFRSRWTVGSYDHDGFVTSKTTGQKTGSLEDDVLRADLLWTPTERVAIRLIRQEDELTSTQPRIQSFINPRIAQLSGAQVGVAEAYDIACQASSQCVGGYNNVWNTAGFPGGTLSEFESRTESTIPNRQELDQTTFSVDVDITDNLHLKYLYGDTEVYNSTYLDWDGSQFNFFVNYNVGKTELDSHEIQLSGGGDRIQWVAGLYQWDQWSRTRGIEWAMGDWQFPIPRPQDGYGQPQILDYNDVLASPACNNVPSDLGITFPGDAWPVPCNGGPFGMGFVGIISTFPNDRLTEASQDGFAYFADVTFSLTDRFDLTVGYRQHDQDNENFDVDVAGNVASGALEARPVLINTEFLPGEAVIGGAIDPSTRSAVSFDADTYRLAASWRITDDMMFYASYNEGFNSGGIQVYFDTLGRIVSQYDPEAIENTEIGFRSDLLDGRLRFNATYFDTDWLGIQLAAQVVDRGTGAVATEIVTQNAASANASGFEFEINYAVTDNLLLIGNVGFLDTEFTSVLAGAPVALTGKRSEFAGAPDETYNLGFQYDTDLRNGGRLTARLNATYWGDYWRSAVVDFRQNVWVDQDTPAGDIWMANARVAYTPPNGDYEVAFWGNNLTDEYNLNSGFFHHLWSFDFGTVDRPREVGVTLRMFLQ